MATLWGDEKSQNQSAFQISGFWGAGDVTAGGEPITSFLQLGGGLEAANTLGEPKVKKKGGKYSAAKQKTQAARDERKQNAAAATLDETHCKSKGLPDFLGYRIRKNLLFEWSRRPAPSQPEERFDELVLTQLASKDPKAAILKSWEFLAKALGPADSKPTVKPIPSVKALQKNLREPIEKIQKDAHQFQFRSPSQKDAVNIIGQCRDAIASLPTR